MYIISKLKANLQPRPQRDTQFTTHVTKANCYGYNNQMYHFSKGYFWSTFCIFRKVSIKLFSLLGHTQASCSIQPFFLFLCPIHYANVEVKKKYIFPLGRIKTVHVCERIIAWPGDHRSMLSRSALKWKSLCMKNSRCPLSFKWIMGTSGYSRQNHFTYVYMWDTDLCAFSVIQTVTDIAWISYFVTILRTLIHLPLMNTSP